MGEVRTIYGTTLISESGYNESVVASLESILQKARDGEIVGFSGILNYKDGSLSTTCSGAAATYTSLGAATGLVHRLAQALT